MQGPTDESQLVAELRKQYDVVEVDPSKPITDRYDVLLAVQPSSLTPDEMENFVKVVADGQPTAIFEDPYPWPQLYPDVVGTAQQKRPPGGMMGMFGGGGPPEQKGDISKLWNLLGVEMYGDEIVWQEFNPEPKLGEIEPEWIFIDEGLAEAEGGRGTLHPFDPDDEISKGMQQVLFLVPGSFKPASDSKLDFNKLAVTGRKSGTISYQEYEGLMRNRGMMGVRRNFTREPYIIAARVSGKVTPEDQLYLSGSDTKQGISSADSSTAKAGESQGANNGAAASATGSDAAKTPSDKAPADADPLAGKAPEKVELNAVLVADIDWIAPIIFWIRERGQDADFVIDWKFQNVTFVLNILDSLAGDDRFIDLRKRSRSHRILTKIEEATEEYRQASLEEQTKFINEARQQIETAQQEFRTKMEELRNQKDLDPRHLMQLVEREQIRLERIRDVKISALEKERNRQVKQSERELAAQIRGVQDRYKLLAVLLPPIPPVLLAFFVFFHRRKAEQEGVDTRRLRFGKAPGETDS
jgi:ABC-2 type transport system permease protein